MSLGLTSCDEYYRTAGRMYNENIVEQPSSSTISEFIKYNMTNICYLTINHVVRTVTFNFSSLSRAPACDSILLNPESLPIGH